MSSFQTLCFSLHSLNISRSFDKAIIFYDTGKLSWYLLEEKVKKSNSRFRTMELKAILTLIVLFSLVNFGATFVRPRPQLIEFSQDFGFLKALKNMFGIERKPEKNEINPEQFESLRKKLRCATWARYYQLPYFENYCLAALNKKTPKIQRHVFDYGLF